MDMPEEMPLPKDRLRPSAVFLSQRKTCLVEPAVLSAQRHWGRDWPCSGPPACGLQARLALAGEIRSLGASWHPNPSQGPLSIVRPPDCDWEFVPIELRPWGRDVPTFFAGAMWAPRGL